jgi:predicted nucleic acid-binding Zn ribbon protein
MEQIKDILNQVVKNISDQKPQQEQDIQKAWEAAVNKKTAQHTHLVGVKKGKLLIFVDSPVRVFELTLHKNQILKKMQQQIPELLDITFKIGKVT